MQLEDNNKKPVVAHYSSTFLPFTCNWLYHQLIFQKNIRPVFLTRKARNLERFTGVEVHSLDEFNRLRQVAELAYFKLTGGFRFMEKVCSMRQARVFHVHFGYHGAKMAAMARKLGIPAICSFYGDDAYNFPLRRGSHVYHQLFTSFNRVLVLGQEMRNQLIRLGCPPQKILIHHFGTPVQSVLYQQREIKPGEPIRFMLASNLVQKKGVDIALRAFAKLAPAYSFTVDILGEGPLEAELKLLANQLGLTARVNFYRFKPHDKLIEHMHTAHVFVQASRTTKDNRKEGTPAVLMDALASGMPVVSTRHSDIPEVVVDGLNGFLAEENDVDSLVQALQKVLEHPEVIGQLGKHGREYVAREFDAQVQAQRLEQIYFSLMEEKAPY
jgi:colanic acid/amylovoran biosynthesis glycosyltransferase